MLANGELRPSPVRNPPQAEQSRVQAAESAIVTGDMDSYWTAVGRSASLFMSFDPACLSSGRSAAADSGNGHCNMDGEPFTPTVTAGYR